MSYLRGSPNYVWCTTSVLGKGATGSVFQGVSKHDGEPVAVKTFNQLSHMRPQEVQVREFEVLKKVKHENIVKLLAIEEEQDGRGKVIVMELCTGGSLFNILDDPQNTYGLQEDEFLLVLEHLSAGMKHLRDHSLVHRDLKPGNIMKFVAEDGRVIFKLTDFGAARELEEDGEFMSLYGTEEYLHPDMYERAVLRKPMGKSYSAFVDLWSIGVTLFHVATGSLPFRPYGGRKNKEMMYYIVTKKESGVVSGIQSTENGPVEWKRELPPSSQLSEGLKALITPLLAGLMEVDPRKRWTFDNFFSAVTDFLSRTLIHLFYVNRIQGLRVYLEPETQSPGTSPLLRFQRHVQDQTDIPPETQILLYKNKALTTELQDGAWPSTSESSPLILLHRENNNVGFEWEVKDLAKFPTFPNLVNVENDASLAKTSCGVGYSYQRRIEKIARSVELIKKSVASFLGVVVSELAALFMESEEVRTLCSALGSQLGLMKSFQENALAQLLIIMSKSLEGAIKDGSCLLETGNDYKVNIEKMSEIVESQQESFRAISNHLQTLDHPIRQLHGRIVENRVLVKEWESSIQGIKDISRSPITASTHVSKLRDSWQHLLRDRATRSLTYNDEQFHILERIKMQEKARCLSELLNEECQLVLVRLTEVLSDWYKTAQAAFIQMEILRKDMTQLKVNLNSFSQRLDGGIQDFHTKLGTITASLRTFQSDSQTKEGLNSSLNEEELKVDLSLEPVQTLASNPNLHNLRTHQGAKEPSRSHSQGYKDLADVQQEVWKILKENDLLVTKFQSLTLSILNQERSLLYTNNSLDSSPDPDEHEPENRRFGDIQP